MVGNQKLTAVSAVANSMYFGLKRTHRIGSHFSRFNAHTLSPVSAFQMCNNPSVLPDKMYCESGLNDASRFMAVLFWRPEIQRYKILRLNKFAEHFGCFERQTYQKLYAILCHCMHQSIEWLIHLYWSWWPFHRAKISNRSIRNFLRDSFWM